MVDINYVLASLIPVIGLIINAGTHIAIFRSRILPQLKSIIFSFFDGMFIVALLTFAFCTFLEDLDFVSQLILNEISYVALGYCYFHFVNLGETARRIRIIREISESGKTGLTEEEILERYNAKHMVQVRLERLINNGQIVEENGRYYLHGSPMMMFFASTILFLKVFLLGKRSETE